MPRKPKVIDKPWSRLPKESEAAYQSFLAYRDLGASRSLDKVAANLRGDAKPDGIRAGGSLFRWSSAHRWTERARAWDNDIQSRKDEVSIRNTVRWETRRLEVLEEAWEDAKELRAKVRKMLAFPISSIVQSEDGKTHVHPAKWNFSTVAAMAKIIIEIQTAVLTAVESPIEKLTKAELIAINEANHEFMAKQIESEKRGSTSA